MSLLTLVCSFKSLLTSASVQTEIIRCGHQMCTRNRCRRPIPKRRGIKCFEGTMVHSGQALVTQRKLVFHPGMNVGIKDDYTLEALVDGLVKVSCEVFDPNFDNQMNIRFYDHRRGQKMYKKYFNIIPKPQENRFKLVEVV